MARNQGPIMPDDESTPVSRADDERGNGGSFRRPTKRSATSVDDDLDNRFAGLDEEDDEQQFRRAPKRPQVRRSAVTKKVANRLKIAIIAMIVVGAFATIGILFYSYGKGSWRFRIDSSDNIEITGNKHVTRSQIMKQVMGEDIGRNVFSVPLDEQKKKLEQITWVKSATVMRILPNRLRVDILERTPVAFVQFGQRVELIDATGVVMDIPIGTQGNWAFPVIVGMRESDPLSTRAAKMKIYDRLITDLDSTGEKNSQDLNEVDLGDPEDVKITVADSEKSILIHLGDSNFLDRFKMFKTHVQEWRQQYANLDSVDLRYDRQVILNPDSKGVDPPKTVSTATKPTVKQVAKPVQRAISKPAAKKRHK
jgi:cell division protein FtsQ